MAGRCSMSRTEDLAMKKVLPTIVALPLALVSMLYPVADDAGVSTTVVISEFRTRGPRPGQPFLDEFVELYNLSASAVSLAGWQLRMSGNTGWDGLVTDLPPVVLSPGCHYL